MGFHLFSKYFMSIALDFLIFEFLLHFENMMFKYGLGIFVKFVIWVLLILIA